MVQFIKSFDDDLKNKNLTIQPQQHYVRPQYQSYMTTPEWRNVEMSEHLSEFLSEGHSIFHFSYSHEIYEIWRILFHSLLAARRYDSMWDVLLSDYMVMDIFVATFTTAELLPKVILSLVLYPFLKSTNNTKMQTAIADYYAFYAEDIETKPFFNHDFQACRKILSEEYNTCEEKTWVDWFSWNMVAIDLFCKEWMSNIMHFCYQEESDPAPSTTKMIVKFDLDGHVEEEDAKAQFKEALGRAEESMLKQLDESRRNDQNGEGVPCLFKTSRGRKEEDEIKLVDDDIRVKVKQGLEDGSQNTHTSVYACITAPRFMDFRIAVAALEQKGIHIRKIAGQDHVQVKCKFVADDLSKDTLDVACQEKEAACKKQDALQGTSLLYTYDDHNHPNRRYCLFDAPVKDLHKVLNALEEPFAEGRVTPTIKFIHNF